MKIKGFTVIEILVCIAIIAVLAALLFPLFSSTKRRSVEVYCHNNLRQLWLAAQSYESDFGVPPPNNYVLPAWRDYILSNNFRCPISVSSEQASRQTGDYVVAFDNRPGSVGSSRVDCAVLRGSSMPVAYDDNHAMTINAASIGYRANLFVRQDGSLGRTVGNLLQQFALHPEKFPCPFANARDNF